MKKTIVLLLSVCISSFAGAYVVTFENLKPGGEFHAGDSFISSQMTATAVDMSPIPGSAQVQNTGAAGGAGNEIWLSNIILNFSYAVKPLEGVSFMFGEYGGNVSLMINGDQENVADFSALNYQTVGGATVFVAGSNTSGSIFVIGKVNSFGIGGEELAIDNIIACIPEPASMALLALGGLFLRKRK